MVTCQQKCHIWLISQILYMVPLQYFVTVCQLPNIVTRAYNYFIYLFNLISIKTFWFNWNFHQNIQNIKNYCVTNLYRNDMRIFSCDIVMCIDVSKAQITRRNISLVKMVTTKISQKCCSKIGKTHDTTISLVTNCRNFWQNARRYFLFYPVLSSTFH